MSTSNPSVTISVQAEFGKCGHRFVPKRLQGSSDSLSSLAQGRAQRHAALVFSAQPPRARPRQPSNTPLSFLAFFSSTLLPNQENKNEENTRARFERGPTAERECCTKGGTRWGVRVGRGGTGPGASSPLLCFGSRGGVRYKTVSDDQSCRSELVRFGDVPVSWPKRRLRFRFHSFSRPHRRPPARRRNRKDTRRGWSSVGRRLPTRRAPLLPLCESSSAAVIGNFAGS